MTVSNGVCVETRERIWVDGDPELARAFMAEVKQTKAGKNYFSVYASPANHEKVIEAVWKLHPDAEYVTVAAFVDAIGTLLAAGALQATRAVEAPAPVVPPTPVPVDRNGRPLTQSQIQWAEFSRWSDAPTTSSAMIKERARTEPAYASFVRTNLRREMDQPIDGDVRGPSNPHIGETTTPSKAGMTDERLVQFANTYRLMSAEEVRKRRRLDMNPLTAVQFCKDVDRAIELGLL